MRSPKAPHRDLDDEPRELLQREISVLENKSLFEYLQDTPISITVRS